METNPANQFPSSPDKGHEPDKEHEGASAEQETHEGASEQTVVGIGASAGGLAALKAFFERVPADSGLTWVVVVHLAPEQESHLADLLQPHAKIPVQQVTQTVELEADRAYVIPPGANLDAIDTHLRLSVLEERRMERAPIDHFFRTLALTHDGNAVAIVLTGTGSDGALGIMEVKAQGGLTIVQEPSEAAYDGMPQAAIATGMVDLTLPLVAIPEAALRFAQTKPQVPLPEQGEGGREVERRLLQQMFGHIRARTGRDFSRYKHSTLIRRIARRMQLHHVEEFEDYLDLLRRDPQEIHALADDLLVNVTSFFRDAEVFDTLQREVIPRLFEGKAQGNEVRVWSVGCATGEEAYSLAILLIEEATRRGMEAPTDAGVPTPPLRVFASDLHERSLDHARAGFYPGDIAADVSAERLERFFVKEDGGYRVRKEVREVVIFAPHNLLSDPPFSRLDLISCRNVLIYLQREVQRDVIELLHYALRPDGYLVLGTAETSDSTDLFRAVDKERCIFQRRNAPRSELRLPVFPLTRLRFTGTPGIAERPAEPVAYGSLYQRMLESYAPPSMLVNPENRVVYLSEHAWRYLVHPGGELTADVFKLVRKEFQVELRAALHTARKQGAPVRSKPIRSEEGTVVVEVHPASGTEGEGFTLVLFDERPSGEPPAPPAGEGNRAGAEPSADRIGDLEAELALERQRFQAVVEEYETSREEMRASNEELQSSNEELRSTMEELETSKEELQSMNEELQTVNQENRHKVEELAQLSSDLQNLMAATEIATLFLDRELRILRFTPRATELFNVRSVDRGRPLADLTHRLGYEHMIDDAQAVLDKLVPVEREVQDQKGRWYLSHVLPYRSGEDRIAGVVLTFIDITERKHAEDELRDAKGYAESIVETLHEPLLVLTPDLHVQTANQAFYDHFEVKQKATEGELVYELGNGQWDIPELRTLLEDVLPDSNVFNDYEVRHVFEGLGERVMLLNARRLDHVQLILLGIRDITERKRAEETVRASEERFRSYVVYRMSPDWSEMRQLDGRGFIADTTHPSTTWLDEYIHSDDQTTVMAAIREAIRTKSMFELQHRVRRVDGTLGWTLSRAVPILNDDGEIVEWFGAASDVTARKEAEEKLRESEELHRTLFESIDEGVCLIEREPLRPDGLRDYRYLAMNAAMQAMFCIPDLTGQSIRDNFPDEVEAWYDDYDHVLETGESLRFVRESEPQGVVLEMFVTRLEDDSGRLLAVMQDVTERKRAEEALRESEERFRSLFRESRDVILVADDDGVYTDANPAATQLLGYAHDELVGMRISDISDVDEAAFLEAWEAFKQERRMQGEYRLRTKDGRTLDVEFSAVANVQPGQHMSTLRDITERKQLDAALRESERRVRELARAVTLAEQRERRRIAHVLHEDLQQRLVAARMVGALRADEVPSPERVADLQKMLNEAVAISRTLSHELSPPILRGTELYDLLRWLAEQARKQYELDVEVVVEEGAEVSDEALRIMLYQLIRELFLNVVKHAGTHRARLTGEVDDGMVRVCVEDEGDGFDPASLDALTTGVGLANIRERLELIGGQLAVASTPGEGTRITISIPQRFPTTA